MLPQVEVIKKAYMQGEIEVEEPPQEGEGDKEAHSASPLNVGHNIYILAHQVSGPTVCGTHGWVCRGLS